MNILQVFLEIILFLLAIVICFYLPGRFLLAKLKLTLGSPEDLFFPFILGIMMFTLTAYIFSWLKLEFMIFPLFLIIGFLALKIKKWFPKNIEKLHRWPLFVVVALSIIFSFSMLMTGVYGDSIFYRRDDLWHLSLINELKNNFPPDHPGFAQASLKGYHFFYNFVLAKISNIFFISPASLHFHYFPLFIAFLWGIGVYSLMYKWSKKIPVGLWAVFLSMFGGSFAFILRLRGHENLSLDSAFGMQQPISSLINPPFAVSIVIIIAVLFSLYQYLQSKENKWLVPVVLCVGLITMFKVYAGIILLSGFIFFVLLQLFKRKYALLTASFFIGILFVVTYGIFRDHSSILIYAPLWAPHNVLIDNMPWYRYDEKIYTFTKLSVIKGIVETELYSLYVFFFGNLGTRLIGILFLPLLFLQRKKKPSFLSFTVIIMVLISILIPLFFIQSGKVFEIIQMTWYFLFFASLIAAFGFYKFFNLSYSRLLKVFLFILILIITLPSAYENYRGYFFFFRSQGTQLSDSYFKAMQFLQSQGNYNETVIGIPDKNVHANKKEILSWYRSSSPAIVAFGNKRGYLNNEYIDFTGLDYKSRIDFIRKIIIFNNSPMNDLNLQNEIRQGLEDNKIVFIYSPYSLLSFEKMSFISKVFENRTASIYRVEHKNYQ